MANNKIVYNGTTLIDLTSDDVIESDVAQGKIFHKADGTQAIGTASGGGGDTFADVFFVANSDYENNTITRIDKNYLCAYGVLGTAKFGACTAIVNDYMFYYCPNLTSVNFPVLTSISGSSTFRNAAALTSASLPLLEEMVGSYTFAYSGLTSISLPEMTGMGGSYNFAYCYSLQTASLPKCEVLSSLLFYNDSALQTVDISAATAITPSCFRGCSSLEELTFGDVTSVAAYAFYGCTNCLVYDFSHCTTIPTLANKNAFGNINANAQIKVPAALYDSWIIAANWNDYTIAPHIVGV